jgi:hypothetical protein
MATTNKPLLTRAGLVVLVLLLASGAIFAGRAVVKKYVLDGRDIPDAAPGTTADETVTFTDEKAGIKVSYPEDWKQIENNSRIDLSEDESSEVRLVAGPAQDEPALLLRVKPLPAEINYDPDMSANDLGIIQGQLDKLISPDVEVLERTPINHKGKLGFHYLYVLKQQSTGREGVHSHYFVFDGAKLNVLVFEVFPRTEFEEIAPTFDRIFESFESEKRDGPPVASPTASAEATLAPAQP